LKNKTNRYRARFCGLFSEIPSATNSNKVLYKINNIAFINMENRDGDGGLMVVMIAKTFDESVGFIG
jgi:hypothetical protein